MKKKEIVTLVVSLCVIGVAVFFMIQLLFPKPAVDPSSKESNKIPTIPQSVDETTYKNIENLSDYGQVTLGNIGKSDLFAGF